MYQKCQLNIHQYVVFEKNTSKLDVTCLPDIKMVAKLKTQSYRYSFTENARKPENKLNGKWSAPNSEQGHFLGS